MTPGKETERRILGAVLGNLFRSRDHSFPFPWSSSSLDGMNLVRNAFKCAN